MPTRAFDFDSPAGLRLSGRLEVPDGDVSGWAAFAHCFTCGKSAIAAVQVSRALARASIGVLRFDFAGLGASEGEFGGTNFATNVEDLVAAGQAMARQGMPPGLLIGHSFGGAAALAAAAGMSTVRAVATIAAPFDVSHILTQFNAGAVAELELTGEAEVRLAGRTFRMRQTFVDDARSQVQAGRIAGLGRGLLVLHAPGDEIVGIENATGIFAAARHPKSFVSLADADHLLTRRSDADYAGALVAAWAARYLEPRPPAAPKPLP